MSKVLLKIELAGNLSSRPDLIEPAHPAANTLYSDSLINLSLTMDSPINKELILDGNLCW